MSTLRWICVIILVLCGWWQWNHQNQHWDFENKVTGHLKIAADTSNVEVAKQHLDIAINYLGTHNLTSGNTSVFREVPSNDINIWYQNLKDSRKLLDTLKTDSPPLEISNVLMKVRETLVDDTDKGVKVTAPDNIEHYPNQGSSVFWSYATVIIGLLTLMVLGASFDPRFN